MKNIQEAEVRIEEARIEEVRIEEVEERRVDFMTESAPTNTGLI